MILVVCALPKELDDSRAPDGVKVLHCGVGKINAASATTAALIGERPRLVTNYGTAGKLNASLRGLVEVKRVIQRDMIAEPLAPRGVTPLSHEPHEYASGHGTVVCGTGDSFVMASDPWLVENGVDIVEMELFAIAHACHRFGVPWRSFKFITDDANDAAADDWTANHNSGQDLFWDALKREVLG